METNDANRTELLLLLSEPAASGRFEQGELDYILGKSADIYEAAAMGWRMKADKIIATGGLVQSLTLGSENIRFASMGDILEYCNARARQFEQKSVGAASSSWILSLDSGTIGPKVITED